MQTIDKLEQGGGVRGAGSAITDAAERLRCEAAVLEAILQVESRGEPFDGKGRLIILPEKHVFFRELPANLRTRAQALGLAVRRWSRSNYGGLGRAGDDRRWDRLRAMVGLHETAGFRSASYGGPQIMGFNAQQVGYRTVTAFVEAMAQSEENQIEAFVAFLESVGLADALRQKDFRTVARRYNGSGQVDRYAAMMQRAYFQITGSNAEVASPARRQALREGSQGYQVRALQERLAELGYPLQVDGDFGPATRHQVVAFQSDNGLSVDGIVGPRTSEKLQTAAPREERPDHGREELTVSDLRKRGSQTVKHADRGGLWGWLSVFFGSAAAAAENEGVVAAIPIVGEQINSAVSVLSPVTGWLVANPGLALAAIGAGAVFITWQIKKRRLHDAKTWRHVA